MSNPFKLTFNITKERQLILYDALLKRLFLVLILALIYYSYHWNYLVNIQGNILAWMYRHWLGINTTFNPPDFSGSLYGVTTLSKACLYIELYAYMIPFLYDTKKSVWKNVLIILAVMAVIQGINFLRIFTSVWWRISYDVPRWLYHDLPDILIWYPICIGSMIYGSFKFHPVSAKIERVKKDE